MLIASKCRMYPNKLQEEHRKDPLAHAGIFTIFSLMSGTQSTVLQVPECLTIPAVHL